MCGSSAAVICFGRLPKWPTGADCKSAGLRLRWFESSTYHHFFRPEKCATIKKLIFVCRLKISKTGDFFGDIK
jgi:hypothetical protein